MYLEYEMRQKIGAQPGFEYQYRQVFDLVRSLQLHHNAFRPLIF